MASVSIGDNTQVRSRHTARRGSGTSAPSRSGSHNPSLSRWRSCPESWGSRPETPGLRSRRCGGCRRGSRPCHGPPRPSSSRSSRPCRPCRRWAGTGVPVSGPWRKETGGDGGLGDAGGSRHGRRRTGWRHRSWKRRGGHHHSVSVGFHLKSIKIADLLPASIVSINKVEHTFFVASVSIEGPEPDLPTGILFLLPFITNVCWCRFESDWSLMALIWVSKPTDPAGRINAAVGEIRF